MDVPRLLNAVVRFSFCLYFASCCVDRIFGFSFLSPVDISQQFNSISI